MIFHSDKKEVKKAKITLTLRDKYDKMINGLNRN